MTDYAHSGPTHESVVERLVGSVSKQGIAPAQTALDDEDDAAYYAAIVQVWNAMRQSTIRPRSPHLDQYEQEEGGHCTTSAPNRITSARVEASKSMSSELSSHATAGSPDWRPSAGVRRLHHEYRMEPGAIIYCHPCAICRRLGREYLRQRPGVGSLNGAGPTRKHRRPRSVGSLPPRRGGCHAQCRSLGALMSASRRGA
jgi:hypothetical protein